MSRPRRIKVNTALRFYHEVLELEHLQYGLWDGEARTLDGLRQAQQRYADTLHAWIPKGVVSVLDVGCGTGAGSLALKAKGYAVEGLSPDPYQQDLYRRVERPFHLVRFQDFEPEKPYDLVLMSESCQYVWLPSLFPAVRRVAPGGHLLIADYFVTAAAGGHLSRSGHPLDAFLDAARSHGLELVREEDVTERVLPTLDLARGWLERTVLPCLGIAGDSLQSRRPWLWRLARLLFGRRVLDKLEETRELVDRDRFRAVKRYLFLLFAVPALRTQGADAPSRAPGAASG